MSMTTADAQKIAQALIDLLGKSSMSGNNKAFSTNSNVRLSRVGKKSDANDPETFIEALDDLTKKVKKSAENWGKQKEKTRDLLNGDRARKVNDEYLKSLRDTADAAGNYSKSIAKAYADAVESNKDNRKAQQAIYNNMNAYTSSMDVLLKYKNSTLTKLSEEDAKEVFLARARVKEAAEQLEKQGILVDVVDNWTAFKKKQASILEEVVESNKKLLKTTEDFVDELTVVHNKEIKAREKLNADVEKFSAAVASATVDTVKNLVNLIPSRAQNFQPENDFSNAAAMGVSVTDMNPALNNMRHSLLLSGKSTSEFNNQLEESGNYLHQFGLLGKDALDRLEFTSKSLIDSGIKPSSEYNNKMRDLLAQNSAFQGISQKESESQLQELINSPGFQSLASITDGDGRKKLLEDQLINLKKISMSSGYSSKYLATMLQDDLNKRKGNLADKIVSNVKLKIDMAAMDRMGLNSTDEEKMAVRLKGQGITLDATQQAAFDAVLSRYSKLLNRQEIKQGTEIAETGSPKTNAGATFLHDVMKSYNPLEQYRDFGTEANTAKDTRGVAIASTDWNKFIEQSKNNVSAFDKTLMEATERLKGALASPVGQAGSRLVGGAMSVVTSAIAGAVAGAITAGGAGLVATIGTAISTVIVGALSVASAGVRGWFAGGAIRDQYMKTETGQKFDEKLGSAIAHTLAFFGNDEAQAAVNSAKLAEETLATTPVAIKQPPATTPVMIKQPPPPSPNDTIKDAATGGKIINESGAEVELKDDTLKRLQEIAVNTKNTTDTIAKGNDDYVTTEQQKVEDALRERSLRGTAQRYLDQKRELFAGNFDVFNA